MPWLGAMVGQIGNFDTSESSQNCIQMWTGFNTSAALCQRLVSGHGATEEKVEPDCRGADQTC